MSDKQRISFQRIYYGYTYKSDTQKPVIRLQGFYLQKYGFEVGKIVAITCTPGKIVIEALSPSNS